MAPMTPDALRRLAGTLQRYLAEVRTPWKPAAEVIPQAPVPSPRLPVSADALDISIAAERTLRAVIADLRDTLGESAPAAPSRKASAPTLAAWLHRHAVRVAHVLDESSQTDLSILHERLSKHHGEPTEAELEQQRQVNLQRAAGLPSDVSADARSIAQLATMTGRRVAASTVHGWAAKGFIPFTDDRPRRYRLSDVTAEYDRRHPAADEVAA